MIRGILLCLILLGSISAYLPREGVTSDEQEYLSIIESYARRLKKLSIVGMNTSEAEQYISNALSLLNKGELTIEEKEWITGNLTLAGIFIDRLEENYPSFIFWRNLEVTLTILGLISIPILTYVLLPRVWALVWFKTRRKWIVKRSRVK
ncbi:MAG: hypothetical protein QXP68_06690 [Thermosphaera sp.]